MLPIIYHGIWLPGKGWLKRNGNLGECVAFTDRRVAEATAKRVGQGAKVHYIDDSLSVLEGYFLDLEKKRRFRFPKFKLFKRG